MKTNSKYKILIGVITFVFFFISLNTNAKVKKKETTITCPSGDRYRCYSDPDIGEVKKGKGISTVDKLI